MRDERGGHRDEAIRAQVDDLDRLRDKRVDGDRRIVELVGARIERFERVEVCGSPPAASSKRFAAHVEVEKARRQRGQRAQLILGHVEMLQVADGGERALVDRLERVAGERERVYRGKAAEIAGFDATHAI